MRTKEPLYALRRRLRNSVRTALDHGAFSANGVRRYWCNPKCLKFQLERPLSPLDFAELERTLTRLGATAVRFAWRVSYTYGNREPCLFVYTSGSGNRIKTTWEVPANPWLREKLYRK